MKTLELSNIETKQIFILAFRYALGRTSYVTHDISNLIILNWENLTGRISDQTKEPGLKKKFQKRLMQIVQEWILM